MKNVLLPALLTATLFAGQHAAQAQSASPPVRTETVRYMDLDLTRPAGVAMLDRRIAMAITRVCDQHDPHSLAAASEERRCRANAQFAANNQRAVVLASANPGSIQLSGR